MIQKYEVYQNPSIYIFISQILHGEQYIEVFKPLPTSGTLTSKARIADVLDKGSGALILTDGRCTSLQKHAHAIECYIQIFIFSCKN